MQFTPEPRGVGLRMRRAFAAALVAAGAASMAALLGSVTPAEAAAPPAGTVIRNIARASYVPPSTGRLETVYSNPVGATVLAVEALTLTQDLAVTRPPSAIVSLSHLLANTGNTASGYSVAVANDGAGCAADTMNLAALRVVHDLNGNGVADAGEATLALHTPGALRLGPDRTAALLVQGEIGNVASGQACVTLTATADTGAASGTVRDRVTVAATAVLVSKKAAQFKAEPTGGQRRVDFTVSSTNIGAQDARPAKVVAPSGTPLMVDGAPRSMVLVRDLVPPGTRYLPGSLRSTATDALRLFRLPGDPPFSYRTAEDASAIEVAVGLEKGVARNASTEMAFAVQELRKLDGGIRNTAESYYDNGVARVMEPSNTVVVPGTRALIGIAMSASIPRTNRTPNGATDGTATFRFTVYLRNYGQVTLYDLKTTHVMEGLGMFDLGTYTSATRPEPYQYTVVPGTITITQPGPANAGGVVAAVNPDFNGTPGASDLMAEGSVLPPGAQIILEFDARINFTDRPLTLDTTARVSAAGVPGGPPIAHDVSMYSNDPDRNGDGDPTNDTGPTPLWAPVPNLQVKEGVTTRRISDGVYDLDYTVSVTNHGRVEAPAVHVFSNLSCSFGSGAAGEKIASWELTAGPTTTGLLTAAADFTGRAPCDDKAHEDSNPFNIQAERRLSMVDGRRPLAGGLTETITFTVRVTLRPEAIGQPVEVVNKVWAASYDDSQGVQLDAPVAAALDRAPSLLLDPEGVVYDSRTREPVAGATVTYRRLSCQGGPVGAITPAEVYQGDSGVYTFHADGSVSMVTDALGHYEFFLQSPPVKGLCTFSLTVVPPAGSGYRFPSLLLPPEAGVFERCGAVVPHAAAPRPGQSTTYHLRMVGGVGADGLPCEVTHNHIPLDRGTPFGLVLRKDGSKRQAELGDFIDYALTLTNKSGVPLHGVTFHDALPPGFGYVAKSARLNGAPTADPAGGAGPALVFDHPSLVLAPEQMAMVRYRLRIGVGAPTHGEAVNRARATSGGAQSNLAQWAVRVTGGVFSDEAFAFGKVYLDCRRDGRQKGGDEIGVPGVRLYLENGTHVITDVEGKWSLYGLKPITHVLRVDQTTLPPGAKLGVLDNRNAGAPESRFLDVKKGELHKANFIVTNCDDAAVVKDVAARRAAIAARPDSEAEAQVRTRLDPEGKVVPVGDVRGLPASGLALATGSAGALETTSAPLIALPAAPANTKASGFVNGVSGTLGGNPTAAPPPASAAVPRAFTHSAPLGRAIATASTRPLEATLPELPDNTLGFIEPHNGDTVAGRTLNVRVKGPDASFRLSVNGTVMEERRVGKKARLPSRKLAAWEYIGVVLRPGANTLRLEAVDPFGNVRGAPVEITIVAPDDLALIELGLPPSPRAEPRNPVPIRVRLLDAAGVPVTARTQLTLESDRGRWAAEDLNPTEPGTQVFMEGGAAEFMLVPPGEPGDARIRVSAASFSKEVRMAFLPELRPMIGVGIVEGVIDLTKRGTLPLGAMPAGAAFERELTGIASEGSDKRRASGRAAFFFKGAIQGEYLLTAAYDSDKTERERLFRDIRPDEFYPVYGDSAARGFDAQSTQKLYVRIDKDRSFLLYGDFTTASSTEVRSLSQTSRSLTGLKHVYEGERVRITSYASRTAQTQQVEEFRAVGTSGPYHLSAANGEFVANSEQVEVLVRDRNQPDTVLQRTAMTRFVDYTVEPLTRRILFTRAIASVDPNLNPQSIRVSYEVDSGGPKFTVAGTDVQVKVNEALQLGVVAGVDENPQNRRRLHAATALARIGERTTVAAEAVQTRSDLKGQGEGARVEARYQDEKLAAVGLAAKTSEGFDNPGASFSAGRTEGAVRAEYKVDPTLAVRGEVLYGKDAAQRQAQIQAQSQAQNDARRSAAVSLQKKLSETTTAEVGLRHSEGRGVTGSNAGFDYGQVSTYDGQLGGSIGANSVTALGAAAAAGGVDARSQTTVRARLSTQVPHVPKAQVFVEGEQDVNDSDRRVLAVGGNYAVTDKTRVYGRYELISSLYGPQYDAYSLDGTQRNNIGIVGVESNYMTGGRLYNEYRISDGAEGRGVQSAIGVRNTVSLTEQLRVTGGIEHTRDLSGYSNTVSSGTGFAGGLGQSTAITTGVEYLTERLKTSGVFEARNGEDARTRLMSAGFAYKLDPSWSLLARSIVSTSEGQGANAGNARNLQRHQIGVAYRPVEDDTWNALARYERRSEEVVGAGNAAGALNGSSVFGAGGSGSGSSGLPGRTSADIVSAHVNFNPQRGRYLTARYAGKWSRFDDHTLASGYWAHLLHARYTQDIDKDWDFGVQGGLLFGKGGALHKTFGVEVGYQVYRNLWVSLGYNFVGLHERDLTANAFTSKGAYIRLRFKFDETDFGFSSAGGATVADPALR